MDGNSQRDSTDGEPLDEEDEEDGCDVRTCAICADFARQFIEGGGFKQSLREWVRASSNRW